MIRFNGWTRYLAYDLETKKEIAVRRNSEVFDLMSRGSLYIEESTNTILVSKGQNIDVIGFEKYQIVNSQFELVNSYTLKEDEYDEKNIIAIMIGK